MPGVGLAYNRLAAVGFRHGKNGIVLAVIMRTRSGEEEETKRQRAKGSVAHGSDGSSRFRMMRLSTCI